MKKIFLLGLAFVFMMLLPFSAFAYQKKDLLKQLGDKDKVKSALIMKRQWVNYPSYYDREAWAKLLNGLDASIIKDGEDMLDFQWKVVTASDYLSFSHGGSRAEMENAHNANLDAIAKLFWAEMAEGKGRFVPKLADGVFCMCERTTWILSAHMYMQSKQKTFPDHRENIIDLSTGYCGALFSWIYYFMHEEFDKISPMISMRIKDELYKRVINPYMECSDFWWQAFNASPNTMVNNWNPWCNSNVMQCVMLLEDDPEKLADAVYRTMCSVDAFFNYTHYDGACEEGPSYWDGAAGMAFIYLQLLDEVTGGKFSLFEHPMVKSMGEFVVSSYIGDRWGVNFADASARMGGNAPLIYEYGKTIGSNDMMALALELYDGNYFSGKDFRRTMQYLMVKNEMENADLKISPRKFVWYPETQFCYISDKKGNFFATKGGYNAESHNHNDIGSFIYSIDKLPVFIDAGVGTYTAKTFSSQRYTIWTMRSAYHNIPTINGAEQKDGRQYRAYDVKADKSDKSFSADIAKAYPNEAGIKSWVRKYRVKDNSLTISDKFELERTDSPNEIHFMTWGNVDASRPGKVSVSVKGRNAVLIYDNSKFDVSVETIKLDDPKLSDVWGSEIYRITLKAKDLNLKDNYSFEIRKV